MLVKRLDDGKINEKSKKNGFFSDIIDISRLVSGIILLVL